MIEVTVQNDWDQAEARELNMFGAPHWSLARGPAASSMTRSKRWLDIGVALLLLVPLSLVMGVVALLILIAQGRPILYPAARMRGPDQPFTQWKFRSMICDTADSGASGAHKNWRITRLGRFLRQTRLDELPQLFNILRGDMSFVGPRPPLREYVERFPVAYALVLQAKPGVTGLATLIYHRHEDRIMAACTTADATDTAYYQRCLPAKLRIEMIYLRRRTLLLDLWIMWQTLKIVVSRRDVRPRRRGR